MKKFFILLGIVIVFGGGFFAYKKMAKAPENSSDNYHPLSSNTPVSPTTTPTPTESKPSGQTNIKGGAGADYTPPQTENGGETAAPNIQVYEVTYDGKTFSPETTNAKVGDYVFFKNNSQGDFWPLSTEADHLSLNAGKVIFHGGEYKFEFKTAGTWNFGDKLNTTATGKVIVSK